ncbi:MAG TPA: hypothetical protein DIT64_03475 [Verrucomicrobiales bacterium]|nr:hypothetical protein [Verrucomicrobiales bacterium]
MKHLILLFLTILPPAAALRAQSSQTIKLHPQSKTPASLSQFGGAAAMNDKWIIIGEYGNNQGATAAGAAHVFDAVTGKHLRHIVNPKPQDFALFGVSVALSGDHLLIGAIGGGSNGQGEAYLYHAGTGALLRTLEAPSGSMEFGVSVALSGKTAAVGDQDADLGSGEKGAVFVYPDVLANQAPQVIVPADAMPGDEWGMSVALSGRFLLGGSPSHDMEKGAAYLFDLGTGAQLRKFTGSGNDNLGRRVVIAGGRAVLSAPGGDWPVADAGIVRVYDMQSGIFAWNLAAPDGHAGCGHGFSIAASTDHVLVGAPLKTEPNSGVAATGSAYLYDVRSGHLLKQIRLPARKTQDFTGYAVALNRGNALVTSLLADETGPNRGLAVLLTGQAARLGAHSLAVRGASAPGIVDARHGKFTERAINPSGYTVFCGSLEGAGASGGKTAGVFSSMTDGSYADLALTAGMDLTSLGMAGVKAVSFQNPVCNSFSMGVFQAKLAGSGVSPANNLLLLADNGTEVYPLKRTGSSDPALGNAVIASIKQVLQGSKNDLGPAVLVHLKTGAGGVDKSNDSALLALKTKGDVQAFAREGNLSPPGDNFGQIHRAALAVDQAVFCADLISPKLTNQGVFILNTTTNAKEMLLRKGDAAPGVTGAVISAFLGETVDQGNCVLMRGLITGQSITPAQKECLWRMPIGGMASLVARTGTQVQGMGGGITWSKFIQYWTVGGTQVLVHGKIKGPGVAPAADQVLWLLQEDGSHQVLLRKGDPLPDCGNLRVSVIQQIAVNTSHGRYTVRASLLGAPKDGDQVLLAGRTLGTSIALSSLRQPFPRLRKGMAYDGGDGVISKLAGFSWTPLLPGPTGAGANGQAQALNFQNQMVLDLGFANGINEVAVLNP